MVQIRFEERDYECRKDETVLEALTRQGVLLPSSCRSGVCQTCLVRALRGRPPASAQEGLRDTLRLQGYFLACICRPDEPLEVGLVDVARRPCVGKVVARDYYNESVLMLRIRPCDPFTYQAGQFVNLVQTGTGVTRSYSLASLPGEEWLELHIKRVPKGRVSGWLHDRLREGEEVTFFGPAGDCFYVPGRPDQPLLLVGTGTGLAPLYGIVRDALEKHHTGPIHLFHGAVSREGLYLVEALQALARRHANLSYTPCVLEGPPPAGGVQGPIDQVLFDHYGEMGGRRIYLCGDPALVEGMKKRCFLAGASLTEIYADPFTPASG